MAVTDYILEVGGFNDRSNWGELAGVEALKKQIEAVKGDRDWHGYTVRTTWQAGEHLARGGQWAVYTGDAVDALREVWGEKDAEKYADAWGVYCARCADGVCEVLREAED